jgi:xylan 1,4-beta-xylosidase
LGNRRAELIQFKSDLAATPQELKHVWEHTVGSGHAPLALRSDWQAQLALSRRDLGFEHIRFHGILSEPMGTLVKQGDELLYSFFNADQIVDFLLSIGVRPFVELSFMPQALASGEETVFSYGSNVTPPEDYGQWAGLIKKLVQHWVDRYGLPEVRRWFFEVWNEPNMDSFWTGTQADYFKLYRYAANAIKEVDEELRVGGPATAHNGWIEPFLDFCADHNVAVDFVSTHNYPTDPIEGDQDIVSKLAQTERGILERWACETREQAGDHPLYYTEWNTSSGLHDRFHDESYGAAVVTKTLLEVADVVEGYSYWTFSDIFEEDRFWSTPFHGGFGLLTIHGVPKPAYRAFQLLRRLGYQRLPVEGAHETVDAWVVRGDGVLHVVLTNHALPRHAIQTELAHVRVEHAGEPAAVFVERIDQWHANPRQVWKDMGEPDYLSERQVAELIAASQLVKEPFPWSQTDGGLDLEIDLPPHSVAVLSVEFPEYGVAGRQVFLSSGDSC